MTTKEKTLESACLLAVTGSRAYGLHHENSDTDRMGVFIAPTLDVAGLRWHQHDESYSDASPNGDDTTMHEVGKFLRLCLKGNPTLIELLFMNDYETLNEYGKAIVANRDAFIGENPLRAHYEGYAKSQIERVAFDMKRTGEFKIKMARHALRITRQGIDLLEKGEFNVRVSDPQEYFDLTEKPFDDMMESLRQELDRLYNTESRIPDRPDETKIAYILNHIRLNHV